MAVHVTKLARRRLLAVALSGAAAALAACGPLPVPGADQPTPAAKSAAAAAGASTPAPAAAPARAVAPATVRLLTHFARDGKTPREVALKAITDKFEADHAGLKIGFEVIPWPDIPAKFMAGHEGGNGPDLIYASFERRFLAQGSARNLQPMVETWKKDDLDDIQSSVWNLTVVEGKQYGLPQSFYSHTIVYRKDLFEGTGLETTRPTTWAKFVDAARKAMRDSAGR